METLTLEQFNLLPVLKATSRIEEIHAIYIHETLPKKPPTIVTDKGQFRLPATLHSVACRATRIVVGSGQPYEGPTAGVLAEVLQGIANEDSEGANEQTANGEGGDEGTASQGDDDMPLRRLAESLAREALSELGGLLTQSVARHYKERRSGLLAAALETLVGR